MFVHDTTLECVLHVQSVHALDVADAERAAAFIELAPLQEGAKRRAMQAAVAALGNVRGRLAEPGRAQAVRVQVIDDALLRKYEDVLSAPRLRRIALSVLTENAARLLDMPALMARLVDVLATTKWPRGTAQLAMDRLRRCTRRTRAGAAPCSARTMMWRASGRRA